MVVALAIDKHEQALEIFASANSFNPAGIAGPLLRFATPLHGSPNIGSPQDISLAAIMGAEVTEVVKVVVKVAVKVAAAVAVVVVMTVEVAVAVLFSVKKNIGQAVEHRTRSETYCRGVTVFAVTVAFGTPRNELQNELAAG